MYRTRWHLLQRSQCINVLGKSCDKGYQQSEIHIVLWRLCFPSCQRKWDKRTWRPLAYWLLDTCLTNSYIIWRSLQPQDVLDTHHTHAAFREELIYQIFAYKDPVPTAALPPLVTRARTTHVPTAMPNRGFYAWSKYKGGDCLGGVATKDDRAVLGEVSGKCASPSNCFSITCSSLKKD